MVSNLRKQLVQAIEDDFAEDIKKIPEAFYPRPLFIEDNDAKTVRIGVEKIIISETGKIRIEVKSPQGIAWSKSKKTVKLLEFRGEYVARLFNLFSPRAPLASARVGDLINKILDQGGDRVRLENWLRAKFNNFRPEISKGAGILFREAVFRQANKTENGKFLLARLGWAIRNKDISISTWNRLIGLVPILRQFDADNRKLLALFFQNHLLAYAEIGKCRDGEPLWHRLAPKDALPKFREYFLGKGLTPGGWRLITKLGAADLQTLFRWFRDSQPKVIKILNIAAAQRLISFKNLKDFDELLFLPVERFSTSQAGLALLTALLRERQMLEDAYDVRDYLFPTVPADLSPADLELATEGARLVPPKNVTSAWFINRARDWHMRMAPLWERLVDSNLKTDRWPSLIDAYSDGEIAVIPLATAAELNAEGAAMRHCVSGYSDACRAGQSRIFSMTREGQRATVELRFVAGRWAVSQVRGKRNEAAKDFEEAAARLAEKYNAAQFPAAR